MFAFWYTNILIYIIKKLKNLMILINSSFLGLQERSEGTRTSFNAGNIQIELYVNIRQGRY